MRKDLGMLGGIGLGSAGMQLGASRLGGGNMFGGVGTMMPTLVSVTMLKHTIAHTNRAIEKTKLLRM